VFVLDDATWLMRDLLYGVPMLSEHRRKLVPLSRGTRSTMEKNEFEGKWNLIRSQSQKWWSLITDADLIKIDKAEIKFLQFVTLLQTKYRYDRQLAKDEIVRRVAEYETNVKANAVKIQ